MAGFLSVGGSIIFTLLWLPSLYFGGVSIWQVLAIPLLFILAARLSMWAWFSGNVYTRNHAALLTIVGVLVGGWLAGNLWYRATEIPDLGEPFDVKAYEAQLDEAAKSGAGTLLRTAAKKFESQRSRVQEALGPIGEGSFKFLDSDYSTACTLIITEGLPLTDGDQVSPFLDALFAKDWAADCRMAAAMPLGLVLDPRQLQFTPSASREIWNVNINNALYSQMGVFPGTCAPCNCRRGRTPQLDSGLGDAFCPVAATPQFFARRLPRILLACPSPCRLSTAG